MRALKKKRENKDISAMFLTIISLTAVECVNYLNPQTETLINSFIEIKITFLTLFSALIM
jgi:hypothetical protein